MCKFVFNNACKPKGFLGVCVLELMNGGGHRELADWALSNVCISNGYRVLDVGCGGGGNVSRMLDKNKNSVVYGVDYSSVSVMLSRLHNLKSIIQKRCQIEKGDVATMPYAAASFNVVTAFETVYYWPDIERCFREVYRVLRDDGLFVVANGADVDGGWVWDSYIDGMHTYTFSELERHLLSSGFRDVKVYRKKENHMLCLVANK